MADMNLIESPVLFFLNDKIDVMNHDDIVGLCSSFYEEEEVLAAKRTLFTLLDREGDLIERRGDARKKNLPDLCRV